MQSGHMQSPRLMHGARAQVGLLATQVSLPMLAPLLLGTGMLLRSIRTNASFLLPRIGLLVVMLWLLWFANSVVQNTVVYLRRQARLACCAVPMFLLMTGFLILGRLAYIVKTEEQRKRCVLSPLACVWHELLDKYLRDLYR